MRFLSTSLFGYTLAAILLILFLMLFTYIGGMILSINFKGFNEKKRIIQFIMAFALGIVLMYLFVQVFGKLLG